MRYIYALVAVLLLTVTTVPAFAQFTPEFGLTLTMTSGNFHRTITFGYDPRATDTCDTQLGENANYPPPGFKDFFLKNNAPSFTDGATSVDFRHKPTVNPFELDYEWYAVSDQLPYTISWNPSAIPAIINHIYISPAAAPGHILADLKKQSSITVTTTDSTLFYQDCLIRLFYNTESAVEPTVVEQHELLAQLAASPNPYSAGKSTVSFSLSKPAEVAFHAYDEAGRLLMVRTFTGSRGQNVQNVAIADYRGPVYLRVDVSTGAEHQTNQLTLMAE